MDQIVPNLDLKKLEDQSLSKFSFCILKKIESNSYFPDPVPSVPAFAQALEDYVRALSYSGKGSKARIFIKQLKREELERKLFLLFHYCFERANGDIMKFLSSGFSFTHNGRILAADNITG